MSSPALVLPAFEVEQPFETFYVCKVKAKDLLRLAFTDPIRYDEDDELRGIQRRNTRQRAKDIKEFIQGDTAAFPNAIILAANYDENGLLVTDEHRAWRYEDDKVVIPTWEKLASIIDGQHRVYGFEEANDEAKEMDLLCSVYMELPNARQAYLFATINVNQKPVDKSLAYVQFGYNAEDEPDTAWSPDKLAIVLHNRFKDQPDSPFYKHIKLAPALNERQKREQKEATWLVSTATIVDGIMRLISSNPRRDKSVLQQIPLDNRRRGLLAPDRAPLRRLYLDTQDAVLYKIIFNFFSAANELLLEEAVRESYIIKTVGIQALFDVLRYLMSKDQAKDPSFKTVDLTKQRFLRNLAPTTIADFTSNKFQYSGVGRKTIADELLAHLAD